MTCCCCHAPLGVAERIEVATEWEHRLDGYCYACASTRCDAYPGSHPAGTQTKADFVSALARRRCAPAMPDDLDKLRARVATSEDPSLLWKPTVGERAALLRHGSRILATVTIVTVEKVGKRDVVLSNGERLNVNSLSRSLGTWSGRLELRPLDDSYVVRCRRAQKVTAVIRMANKALTEWEKDPEDMAKPQAAIIAIHRGMTAPTSEDPSL